MSVNKVILVGNLGRDPEIRYSPDGLAVANFSIATNESWKDKATGERKDRTEWHRVVTFGRLAEICGEWLSKGKQVYIEGRLQTRSWEQDGITRYMTEVVANEMKMLGRRSDFEDGGGNQSPNPKPQNYNQGGGSNAQQNTPPPVKGNTVKDDIPF